MTQFSLRQLKDHVRNISKGDSYQAQVIIRRYVIERFLERLSYSTLNNNFILKGGTLISAMIGLENRSTLDLDATIKNLPLSLVEAKGYVEQILGVSVEDGLTFEIKSVTPIMTDADYPRVRVTLNSTFEDMRIPIKIDFSTGDVITPSEVEYNYPLLFENRTVPLLAYPLETILAEKLETIISLGTANTRMRDLYDVYALRSAYEQQLNLATLKEALANTAYHRGTNGLIDSADLIFQSIESSPEMSGLWESYQKKFDYARGPVWEDVVRAARTLFDLCRSGD